MEIKKISTKTGRNGSSSNNLNQDSVALQGNSVLKFVDGLSMEDPAIDHIRTIKLQNSGVEPYVSFNCSIHEASYMQQKEFRTNVGTPTRNNMNENSVDNEDLKVNDSSNGRS